MIFLFEDQKATSFVDGLFCRSGNRKAVKKSMKRVVMTEIDNFWKGKAMQPTRLIANNKQQASSQKVQKVFLPNMAFILGNWGAFLGSKNWMGDKGAPRAGFLL